MALGPCDSPALVLNDGRCSAAETARQRAWHMLWLRMAPALAAYSSALLALALLSLWAPLRSWPGALALRRLPHLLPRRRGARGPPTPRHLEP